MLTGRSVSVPIDGRDSLDCSSLDLAASLREAADGPESDGRSAERGTGKGRVGVGVGVAAMSRFRARDAAAAAAAATAAMTAGASGLWTVTLRQWGSSQELYQESV